MEYKNASEKNSGFVERSGIFSYTQKVQRLNLLYRKEPTLCQSISQHIRYDSDSFRRQSFDTNKSHFHLPTYKQKHLSGSLAHEDSFGRGMYAETNDYSLSHLRKTWKKHSFKDAGSQAHPIWWIPKSTPQCSSKRSSSVETDLREQTCWQRGANSYRSRYSERLSAIMKGFEGADQSDAVSCNQNREKPNCGPRATGATLADTFNQVKPLTVAVSKKCKCIDTTCRQTVCTANAGPLTLRRNAKDVAKPGCSRPNETLPSSENMKQGGISVASSIFKTDAKQDKNGTNAASVESTNVETSQTLYGESLGNMNSVSTHGAAFVTGMMDNQSTCSQKWETQMQILARNAAYHELSETATPASSTSSGTFKNYKNSNEKLSKTTCKHGKMIVKEINKDVNNCMSETVKKYDKSNEKLSEPTSKNGKMIIKDKNKDWLTSEEVKASRLVDTLNTKIKLMENPGKIAITDNKKDQLLYANSVRIFENNPADTYKQSSKPSGIVTINDSVNTTTCSTENTGDKTLHNKKLDSLALYSQTSYNTANSFVLNKISSASKSSKIIGSNINKSLKVIESKDKMLKCDNLVKYDATRENKCIAFNTNKHDAISETLQADKYKVTKCPYVKRHFLDSFKKPVEMELSKIKVSSMNKSINTAHGIQSKQLKETNNADMIVHRKDNRKGSVQSDDHLYKSKNGNLADIQKLTDTNSIIPSRTEIRKKASKPSKRVRFGMKTYKMIEPDDTGCILSENFETASETRGNKSKDFKSSDLSKVKEKIRKEVLKKNPLSGLRKGFLSEDIKKKAQLVKQNLTLSKSTKNIERQSSEVGYSETQTKQRKLIDFKSLKLPNKEEAIVQKYMHIKNPTKNRQTDVKRVQNAARAASFNQTNTTEKNNELNANKSSQSQIHLQVETVRDFRTAKAKPTAENCFLPEKACKEYNSNKLHCSPAYGSKKIEKSLAVFYYGESKSESLFNSEPYCQNNNLIFTLKNECMNNSSCLNAEWTGNGVHKTAAGKGVKRNAVKRNAAKRNEIPNSKYSTSVQMNAKANDLEPLKGKDMLVYKRENGNLKYDKLLSNSAASNEQAEILKITQQIKPREYISVQNGLKYKTSDLGSCISKTKVDEKIASADNKPKNIASTMNKTVALYGHNLKRTSSTKNLITPVAKRSTLFEKRKKLTVLEIQNDRNKNLTKIQNLPRKNSGGKGNVICKAMTQKLRRQRVQTQGSTPSYNCLSETNSVSGQNTLLQCSATSPVYTASVNRLNSHKKMNDKKHENSVIKKTKMSQLPVTGRILPNVSTAVSVYCPKNSDPSPSHSHETRKFGTVHEPVNQVVLPSCKPNNTASVDTLYCSTSHCVPLCSHRTDRSNAADYNLLKPPSCNPQVTSDTSQHIQRLVPSVKYKPQVSTDVHYSCCQTNCMSLSRYKSQNNITVDKAHHLTTCVIPSIPSKKSTSVDNKTHCSKSVSSTYKPELTPTFNKVQSQSSDQRLSLVKAREGMAQTPSNNEQLPAVMLLENPSFQKTNVPSSPMPSFKVTTQHRKVLDPSKYQVLPSAVRAQDNSTSIPRRYMPPCEVKQQAPSKPPVLTNNGQSFSVNIQDSTNFGKAIGSSSHKSSSEIKAQDNPSVHKSYGSSNYGGSSTGRLYGSAPTDKVVTQSSCWPSSKDKLCCTSQENEVVSPSTYGPALEHKLYDFSPFGKIASPRSSEPPSTIKSQDPSVCDEVHDPNNKMSLSTVKQSDPTTLNKVQELNRHRPSSAFVTQDHTAFPTVHDPSSHKPSSVVKPHSLTALGKIYDHSISSVSTLNSQNNSAPVKVHDYSSHGPSSAEIPQDPINPGKICENSDDQLSSTVKPTSSKVNDNICHQLSSAVNPQYTAVPCTNHNTGSHHLPSTHKPQGSTAHGKVHNPCSHQTPSDMKPHISTASDKVADCTSHWPSSAVQPQDPTSSVTLHDLSKHRPSLAVTLTSPFALGKEHDSAGPLTVLDSSVHQPPSAVKQKGFTAFVKHVDHSSIKLSSVMIAPGESNDPRNSRQPSSAVKQQDPTTSDKVLDRSSNNPSATVNSHNPTACVEIHNPSSHTLSFAIKSQDPTAPDSIHYCSSHRPSSTIKFKDTTSLGMVCNPTSKKLAYAVSPQNPSGADNPRRNMPSSTSKPQSPSTLDGIHKLSNHISTVKSQLTTAVRQRWSAKAKAQDPTILRDVHRTPNCSPFKVKPPDLSAVGKAQFPSSCVSSLTKKSHNPFTLANGHDPDSHRPYHKVKPQDPTVQVKTSDPSGYRPLSTTKLQDPSLLGKAYDSIGYKPSCTDKPQDTAPLGRVHGTSNKKLSTVKLQEMAPFSLYDCQNRHRPSSIVDIQDYTPVGKIDLASSQQVLSKDKQVSQVSYPGTGMQSSSRYLPSSRTKSLPKNPAEKNYDPYSQIVSSTFRSTITSPNNMHYDPNSCAPSPTFMPQMNSNISLGWLYDSTSHFFNPHVGTAAVNISNSTNHIPLSSDSTHVSGSNYFGIEHHLASNAWKPQVNTSTVNNLNSSLISTDKPQFTCLPSSIRHTTYSSSPIYRLYDITEVGPEHYPLFYMPSCSYKPQVICDSHFVHSSGNASFPAQQHHWNNRVHDCQYSAYNHSFQSKEPIAQNLDYVNNLPAGEMIDTGAFHYEISSFRKPEHLEKSDQFSISQGSQGEGLNFNHEWRNRCDLAYIRNENHGHVGDEILDRPVDSVGWQATRLHYRINTSHDFPLKQVQNVPLAEVSSRQCYGLQSGYHGEWGCGPYNEFAEATQQHIMPVMDHSNLFRYPDHKNNYSDPITTWILKSLDHKKQNHFTATTDQKMDSITGNHCSPPLKIPVSKITSSASNSPDSGLNLNHFGSYLPGVNFTKGTLGSFSPDLPELIEFVLDASNSHNTTFDKVASLATPVLPPLIDRLTVANQVSETASVSNSPGSELKLNDFDSYLPEGTLSSFSPDLTELIEFVLDASDSHNTAVDKVGSLSTPVLSPAVNRLTVANQMSETIHKEVMVDKTNSKYDLAKISECNLNDNKSDAKIGLRIVVTEPSTNKIPTVKKKVKSDSESVTKATSGKENFDLVTAPSLVQKAILEGSQSLCTATGEISESVSETHAVAMSSVIPKANKLVDKQFETQNVQKQNKNSGLNQKNVSENEKAVAATDMKQVLSTSATGKNTRVLHKLLQSIACMPELVHTNKETLKHFKPNAVDTSCKDNISVKESEKDTSILKTDGSDRKITPSQNASDSIANMCSSKGKEKLNSCSSNEKINNSLQAELGSDCGKEKQDTSASKKKRKPSTEALLYNTAAMFLGEGFDRKMPRKRKRPRDYLSLSGYIQGRTCVTEEKPRKSSSKCMEGKTELSLESKKAELSVKKVRKQHESGNKIGNSEQKETTLSSSFVSASPLKRNVKLKKGRLCHSAENEQAVQKIHAHVKSSYKSCKSKQTDCSIEKLTRNKVSLGSKEKSVPELKVKLTDIMGKRNSQTQCPEYAIKKARMKKEHLSVNDKNVDNKNTQTVCSKRKSVFVKKENKKRKRSKLDAGIGIATTEVREQTLGGSYASVNKSPMEQITKCPVCKAKIQPSKKWTHFKTSHPRTCDVCLLEFPSKVSIIFLGILLAHLSYAQDELL